MTTLKSLTYKKFLRPVTLIMKHLGRVQGNKVPEEELPLIKELITKLLEATIYRVRTKIIKLTN
jgi:hypothetical protein